MHNQATCLRDGWDSPIRDFINGSACRPGAVRCWFESKLSNPPDIHKSPFVVSSFCNLILMIVRKFEAYILGLKSTVLVELDDSVFVGELKQAIKRKHRSD